MTIELTEEERALLRDMLDKVSVSGRDGMKKVLALMEKLEATTE